MWLHVNKETKRIQGYCKYCNYNPTPKEGCELVEVESIPTDWQYCKYENGEIILDEEYKKEKEEEFKLIEIRMQREVECFPFINRGSLWYETLTEERKNELKTWYQAWLDAPATRVIPTKPTWLM